MSRLSSCTTFLSRLTSCQFRQVPLQQRQGQEQQRQQEEQTGAHAAGLGASDPTSLLSGWRLWLAAGAAAGLVPLADFWSERLLQQRWRRAWRSSTGLVQCVLDSPAIARPQRQQVAQQQPEQRRPLEEVARSLTARSVEQACRLCTSRAVAEARAGRPDRARAMWLSAASFSYPPALFNLGLLAATAGMSAEATAYYRAAADLGHPAAAFNLSVLLAEAEDQAEDGATDSDVGHGGGQQQLAVLGGADGRRSAPAVSESRRWLSQAADSGLAEALLLEAERLLDEARPAEAERRLRRLLASGNDGGGQASASAIEAAELLLRRCQRDLGDSDDSCGGLRRCSRSSPNFSNFSAELRGEGEELRPAALRARAAFYPSFYSNCRQLHKY
uniref:TPR_REGION domain-containing protein n=1 Tax=Macrostomum lignano TaxID=282301 RepID=A0A1I8IIJ1_9PLAT